jgi:hypothetical protein
VSGLQRIVRHPDRLNDPHVRARQLASEALFEPLAEADASWLGEHLAGCDACREVVDGFAADALLLRTLRDDLPPVPRDLGARVSLALDDEVRRATRGHRGPAGRDAGRRGSLRRPGFAFAGLAAIAVVALIVGPLVVPRGAPTGTTRPAASLLPEATPITVDPQPVAWASRNADGKYVISSATVGEVCPGVGSSSCGTLDGSARTVASLDVKPSSVLLSKNGNPAVIVGDHAVYAVAVDFAPPVTTAVPGASPVPTNLPVHSPAASGEPASPPAVSPTPSGSPASASPAVTASPSPSEPAASPDQTPATSPSAGPEQTPEPGSPTPTPSGTATSPEPTPEASPQATPEVTPAPATPLPTLPPATPAPSAAAALKIADGVVLVGASPAYSPDGRWVAFSAAPADGSHGPDIYAWRVGQRRAKAVTTDHASVFSGWLEDAILASAARVATTTEKQPSDAVPPASADPSTVVARSFLVDPAHGTVTEIAREGVWRPVVDPTERVVVYWTGTLAWSDAQKAWIPATGRLVSAEWPALRDGQVDAAVRPLPSEASGTSVADWEVRFDPAGRRLGVWVADAADPGTGRLALVDVNNDGTLGSVALHDAAALPGFSLDADRLAWSTPPGRNGEGSLVTVFAWRGDAAGQMRSMPDPGNDAVVVAR